MNDNEIKIVTNINSTQMFGQNKVISFIIRLHKIVCNVINSTR